MLIPKASVRNRDYLLMWRDCLASTLAVLSSMHDISRSSSPKPHYSIYFLISQVWLLECEILYCYVRHTWMLLTQWSDSFMIFHDIMSEPVPAGLECRSCCRLLLHLEHRKERKSTKLPPWSINLGITEHHDAENLLKVISEKHLAHSYRQILVRLRP